MSSKKKSVTIAIDEELVKELDQAAKIAYRNRSSFIEWLLSQHFERAGGQGERHANKT